ncbi:MAG: hypothetical protein CMB80_00410 [Flammeovirgaceae bacterium]|nr:hypothetical protein [Flammeovirgaceae bacterium]|tara:strand:- start:7217 stop:7513 length:297 start_codon:yes stop_codon:yes gene_type:complete
MFRSPVYNFNWDKIKTYADTLLKVRQKRKYYKYVYEKVHLRRAYLYGNLGWEAHIKNRELHKRLFEVEHRSMARLNYLSQMIGTKTFQTMEKTNDCHS